MSAVRIRAATPDDDADVLELLGRCLGWRAEDPMAEFFAWKHRESPFGRSPAWVAEDGGRLVGFRTFMRWSFDTEDGPLRAVRAVDTATDPAARGRGIFRELTMSALEELTSDGVAFVFNTPNDQSRPGYLKMGWTPVGRLPLHTRVRVRPGSLARTARARVPAERWSQATSVGTPADAQRWRETDDPAGRPRDGLLRTATSEEFMRWRFGFGPLRYRVVDTGGVPLVLRVRRRGPASELAVVRVPRSALPRVTGAAIASALRDSGADYAAALGARRPPRFVTLRSAGPLLTARALTVEPPPLERWDLQLSDVELF